MSKFNSIKRLAGVMVVLLCAASPALADTMFVYNGHTYVRVEAGQGITWSDANTAATNAGGYLAVFETAAENAAIVGSAALNVFSGPGFSGMMWGPWFGLYSPTSAGCGNGCDNSDANYVWVNGATRTYSAWMSGEPSGDDDGGLNGVHFFYNNGNTGWNDEDNAPLPHSYLVEYNNVVPEPSSFALAGIALALAIAVCRPR